MMYSYASWGKVRPGLSAPSETRECALDDTRAGILPGLCLWK